MGVAKIEQQLKTVSGRVSALESGKHKRKVDDLLLRLQCLEEQARMGIGTLAASDWLPAQVSTGLGCDPDSEWLSAIAEQSDEEDMSEKDPAEAAEPFTSMLQSGDLQTFRSSLRTGMPVHVEGLGGVASLLNGRAGFLQEWDPVSEKWIIEISGMTSLIGGQFLVP